VKDLLLAHLVKTAATATARATETMDFSRKPKRRKKKQDDPSCTACNALDKVERARGVVKNLGD